MDYTECIEVDYDPKVISYKELLEYFAKFHNPTGGTFSVQYRSLICYYNDEQKQAAQEWKENYEKKKNTRVSTVIQKIGDFYNAEDYHQKFLLQGQPKINKAFKGMDITEFLNSPITTKINGYIGGYGTTSSFEEDVKEWGSILSPDIQSDLRDIVSRNSFE